jgi:hypothetical protein
MMRRVIFIEHKDDAEEVERALASIGFHFVEGPGRDGVGGLPFLFLRRIPALWRGDTWVPGPNRPPPKRPCWNC